MHPKDGFYMSKSTVHALIYFNFDILILLSYIRKENSSTESVAQKRYTKPRAGFMKKDKNIDWLTQANDDKMEKNLNFLLGPKDDKE